MSKRISVIVWGNYSLKGGTVRAAVLLTKTWREYLMLSQRQLRAAEDRLCYAGTDYLRVGEVDGFGPFEPHVDGGQVAYAL